MNPRALAMMAAMAHVEGYFSTANVAWRNRNPGNLRQWGALPQANGYAVFACAADGFSALYRDILANSGKLTLRQFLNKYAPASDGNAPEAYVAAVSEFAGVGAEEMF